MDTYSILRAFADSWGLLAMVVMFLGVVIYTFRPGSREIHEEIAGIPFRHADRPATDCENCENCTCAEGSYDFLSEEKTNGQS